MKTAVGILCALLLLPTVAITQTTADVTVYSSKDKDITVPKVSREVKPRYTAGAMRAGIQGTVELECVVAKDGSPTDVKVTKSLDREYGLDDEAVKALKQWRFVPGRKDDKPVPVRVTVELTFTLKNKK